MNNYITISELWSDFRVIIRVNIRVKAKVSNWVLWTDG